MKSRRGQAVVRREREARHVPEHQTPIHDAALQFVRKLSGTNKPSKRNEEAFEAAVASIAACARELLDTLETSQPPRDREEVAAKARAKSALRFA
jgi:hypothetical protein